MNIAHNNIACKNRASLKSSAYYWPEPVALRATGQVSTLTAHFFIQFFVVTGWAIE